MNNKDEHGLGTNPRQEDTDGDGAKDGDEVALGTDPLNPADIPPDGPVLNVSTTALGFNQTSPTQAPPARSVWITNSGPGELTWTSAEDTSWLNMSPEDGTAPGELVLSIDPLGLEAGVYTGRITTTASGAANSPHLLTVTLKVALPLLDLENQLYLPLVLR